MSVAFMQDWATTGAFIHNETKNFSFIKMSVLYKQLGIKNNMFHLALYDEELRHIDPHSAILSERIQLKVAMECRRNIWYYFREVLRLPASGTNGVPFNANRGNIAMIWCWLNNIDYFSVQPRQTGKAQPLNALIKTSSGWTRMGNIKLGDKITAPDGTSTTVTGLYPQGVKKIYRVTFEDGRQADCCDDHLWKVYNRYRSPEETQWRIISLKEIRQRLEDYPNSESGLFVPLIQPEETPDIELPLDPYLMGVLLGDGGFSTKDVKFSSIDQFILDEVARPAPENVELIHRDRLDCSLVDRPRKRIQDTSPFLDVIRSLKLQGKYSYNKTVPVTYLNASPSQRLALLQGLMDTDGTVDKTGSTTLCTTSFTMAEQIQDLVRGLGGICKIVIRKTNCTYNGVYLEGRESYTLRIRINDRKSLFRFPRKKELVSDTYKSANKLKLGIKSVKYIGNQQAQCISVDHPDHLYITDNFVVTHNTVTAIAISAYTIYIYGRNITMSMLAKDTKLRQANVTRLKDIRTKLPKYLVHVTNRDEDNKEGLSYTFGGSDVTNKYETHVAQGSEEDADNLGRGLSTPSIHIDEIAYFTNIQITFRVLMGSTVAAKESARAAGQPYSHIYTTTAGRIDTVRGRHAYNMAIGAMPFTEKLYDCIDKEDTKRLVRSNSKNNIVNGTFSYLQLGKSHQWFVEMTSQLNVAGDEEEELDIDRDYRNMWKSGTETGLIDVSLLNIMNQNKKEPQHIEILGDYVVSWYIKESELTHSSFKYKQLVLGMDSSENVGRDFTALCLIDAKDMSVVATFRCNESNTIKLGLFIAEFLIKYPNILFIPERKSTGSDIIDTIIMVFQQRALNPIRRIFNKMIQERDSDNMRQIRIDDPSILDSALRKHIGFMTTGSTREILYKLILQKAVKLNASRIYDSVLISEISTLSTVNGRIDHTSSTHDDMVIAYLLACYVLFNGKNLEYYGFNVANMLSGIVPATGESIDPEYKQYQLDLHRKIKHYETLIENTDSELMKRTYVQRINNLKEHIDSEIILEPLSATKIRHDNQTYGNLYLPSSTRQSQIISKYTDNKTLQALTTLM